MPAFCPCLLINGLHTNEARVFQRNITRIIDGKTLQMPAHRPDMFFDLTIILELTRDVRDCDNPIGRIIPEIQIAISQINQHIPTQQQIQTAKNSLSRAIFFRPALLIPGKAYQIELALLDLINCCETYLTKVQPVQQRRAEP